MSLYEDYVKVMDEKKKITDEAQKEKQEREKQLGLLLEKLKKCIKERYDGEFSNDAFPFFDFTTNGYVVRIYVDDDAIVYRLSKFVNRDERKMLYDLKEVEKKDKTLAKRIIEEYEYEWNRYNWDNNHENILKIVFKKVVDYLG